MTRPTPRRCSTPSTDRPEHIFRVVLMPRSAVARRDEGAEGPVKITSRFWPPIHPVWRRCLSVEYCRYAPSSRRASRAPRRPQSANVFLTGPCRQYATEEQSAFAKASARPGHGPNTNGSGGGWRSPDGMPRPENVTARGARRPGRTGGAPAASGTPCVPSGHNGRPPPGSRSGPRNRACARGRR